VSRSALDATREWLERAVIGLNLCPFAKAVYGKGSIHFALSPSGSADRLLEDLGSELEALVASDPAERETTLLVAPHCVQEFLEFNDVVRRGERLIRKRGLEGVIQLASFHPHYCFAGAADDDVANFSNRSPYPTLHLLREASIDKAVQAFPDPQSIYGANRETLERLGPAGWAALDIGGPR
jgi:hypothetical protein